MVIATTLLFDVRGRLRSLERHCGKGQTDMMRAAKQPMMTALRLASTCRFERIIHGNTIRATSVKAFMMW